MSHTQDTITFKVAYGDLEDVKGDAGDDEFGPYVQLDDPETSIERMLNADEIVIQKPKICVAIGYPLRKDYLFMLRADKPTEGFRRGEVALKVAQLYEDIYEIEARTAPDPGRAAPNLYNRGKSGGQYGISCHDLGDLVLADITYDQAADVYRLGVES